LAGSIPYLWDLNDAEDSNIINCYLAETFIVGSILFSLGGTFNIYRAKLVVVHFLQQKTAIDIESTMLIDNQTF
jgi:hypothetical protein